MVCPSFAALSRQSCSTSHASSRSAMVMSSVPPMQFEPASHTVSITYIKKVKTRILKTENKVKPPNRNFLFDYESYLKSVEQCWKAEVNNEIFIPLLPQVSADNTMPNNQARSNSKITAMPIHDCINSSTHSRVGWVPVAWYLGWAGLAQITQDATTLWKTKTI